MGKDKAHPGKRYLQTCKQQELLSGICEKFLLTEKWAK